ncbi:uncharacterized protein LOC115885682 [Sitophilus oryzae]|uniref:RNA-directed DNA polymerase n=1 Tax=Sitophilus oryzae TaxID=7048 RepID=A0A6J2YBA1_SITOR|nr:uncharacterized protein LOC115885682 [Sitophilus oryzae]
MDIYNFRPSHLLDYELDYELFIRQSATTRPVADKRKILSRLLASEKSKPGNNIQLANIELDFNKEQEAIEKSLNSVNLIVEDFEGTESDSTFLRVKSRLSHIAGRVQRIILFSLDPKLLPLVKTYISETNATCLKLEGDLYDKIPSTSNTNESFVSNPVINIPTPIVSCSSRSQPVSEWQIKFDGTGNSLYPFLERLTELASARNVSTSELFNSAAEFFVNDAFVWYRSIKKSVNNWEDLVARLKRDDIDEEIWEQIKMRKQRKNESTVVFIAHLEAFLRDFREHLSKLLKLNKLKGIFFQNLLADLCRRLEEADYLTKKDKRPKECISSLDEPSPSCSKNNHLQDKSPVFKKFFNNKDWSAWLNKVHNFMVTSLVKNRVCKSKVSNKGCIPESSDGNEVSPLFVNKSLDNRPYISVKLYDVSGLTVLLDSGATASVVGSKGLDILNNLNLKIYPANTNYICTADLKQQVVSGIVDLPVAIDNCCHVIKAFVVPSLPQTFIFGCDFAKTFNIVVNFKNDSWHVQREHENSNLCVTDMPSSNDLFPLLNSLDDLSIEQRIRAENIIASFDEISSQDKLGRTDKITLNIDTGDAPPFKRRSFSMSSYMAKILNNELDEMLKLGVKEPSKEPSKHDCYPLPNVERILTSLRNSKFISSIDLRKAFWQIPLDERSKEKTAFAVVGRGLFQFITMPFGLRNAAQTQQCLVDAIFGPKFEPHIFTYLDDILVISEDFDHHIKLLTEVREKLREAGLTINLKKCDFFKTTLKFLGYVVGSNSLRTDPDKVSAMANYPRPRTTTEIKRFVGLCSWYRRFIKDFSTLMSPINNLLKGSKKGQSIEWNTKAENSFLHIKDLLLSAPILSQPNFSEKFFIESDASDTGLGGVLLQKIDGENKIIAYASRSLSRTERNYSTVEKECLAVLFNIEKFRCYIEGVPFSVVTDNHSLLWLNNLSNPSGKLARWSVRLRQHTFDIIHKKGVSNVIADAMSRIPGSEDVQEHTPDISEERVICMIDVDRIDPWYDKMRQKIIDSPENFPQWKVENDFVYKFAPNCLPMNQNLPEWKFLVPKPQRHEVIDSCHSPPTSGHFGFFKTLNRVQELHYWPKMREDILRFVRNCEVCGAQKAPNTARMGLMGKEKVVDLPFQVIAIDLIGPLPRSKKVYNLEDLDGSKAGNWHIKDLKPFNHIEDDQRSLSSED